MDICWDNIEVVFQDTGCVVDLFLHSFFIQKQVAGWWEEDNKTSGSI
jgi:hypothetical protein